MKSIVFLHLALILTISLTAQTTFEKTIGSIDDDDSFSIQECNDNTYVLCGYTTDFYTGDEDIYVIKIDYNGDTLWTKQLGMDYLKSWAYSIYQTNDLGYIVSGFLYINSSNSVPFLLKLDQHGEKEWLNDYSNLVTKGEANSVIQTNNTDIVFCGIYTFYKSKTKLWDQSPFIIRTNSSGEVIWNELYDESGLKYVKSLVQTIDSGFAICGRIDMPEGYYNAGLFKTNQNGVLNWSHTYGDNSSMESVWSVKRTIDGGFILCGSKAYGLMEDNSDVYIVKTDQNGNEEWSRTYGGEENEYGIAVDTTNDGGYIICGKIGSYGTSFYDFWLIRTDSGGDTLWTRTFGGNLSDIATDVCTTSDGGFIICGNTRSFGNGGKDIYIIKTDNYGIVTDVEYNNLMNTKISIFPNPSIGIIRINTEQTISEYTIYNFAGKAMCYRSFLKNNEVFNLDIDISNYETGMYYLKLKTENGWISHKLIKL